jgi:hypothetical protein
MRSSPGKDSSGESSVLLGLRETAVKTHNCAKQPRAEAAKAVDAPVLAVLTSAPVPLAAVAWGRVFRIFRAFSGTKAEKGSRDKT